MTDQPTDQELSAWIAANVAGLVEGVDFGTWPEHDWVYHQYAKGGYCKQCSVQVRDYPTLDPTNASQPCHRPPPAYSEDMGLAWGVVEKLRERGWNHFWIGIHSSVSGRWEATASHYLVDWHAPSGGISESAPRALCLAIWKALGGEKEVP